MSSATEELHVQTSEPPRLHVVPRVRELAGARQILWNLVRKEVKVKYKSSILGMAWSMLNPILYLAVFSVVFGIVLALICLYWTFAYIRRRALAGRRPRRRDLESKR